MTSPYSHYSRTNPPTATSYLTSTSTPTTSYGGAWGASGQPAHTGSATYGLGSTQQGYQTASPVRYGSTTPATPYAAYSQPATSQIQAEKYALEQEQLARTRERLALQREVERLALDREMREKRAQEQRERERERERERLERERRKEREERERRERERKDREREEREREERRRRDREREREREYEARRDRERKERERERREREERERRKREDSERRVAKEREERRQQERRAKAKEKLEALRREEEAAKETCIGYSSLTKHSTAKYYDRLRLPDGPWATFERQLGDLRRRYPNLHVSAHLSRSLCWWTGGWEPKPVDDLCPISKEITFTLCREEFLPEFENPRTLFNGVKYNVRLLIVSGHPTLCNLRNWKVVVGEAYYPVCVGGSWNEELDGGEPTSHETLIKTATRCCRSTCGVDLSVLEVPQERWIKLVELVYERPEEFHNEVSQPAMQERTTLLLLNLWKLDLPAPTVEQDTGTYVLFSQDDLQLSSPPAGTKGEHRGTTRDSGIRVNRETGQLEMLLREQARCTLTEVEVEVREEVIEATPAEVDGGEEKEEGEANTEQQQQDTENTNQEEEKAEEAEEDKEEPEKTNEEDSDMQEDKAQEENTNEEAQPEEEEKKDETEEKEEEDPIVAENKELSANPEKMRQLLVKDIRVLCEKRKLSTAGRKADMIKRLTEYLKSEMEEKPKVQKQEDPKTGASTPTTTPIATPATTTPSVDALAPAKEVPTFIIKKVYHQHLVKDKVLVNLAAVPLLDILQYRDDSHKEKTFELLYGIELIRELFCAQYGKIVYRALKEFTATVLVKKQELRAARKRQLEADIEESQRKKAKLAEDRDRVLKEAAEKNKKNEEQQKIERGEIREADLIELKLKEEEAKAKAKAAPTSPGGSGDAEKADDADKKEEEKADEQQEQQQAGDSTVEGDEQQADDTEENKADEPEEETAMETEQTEEQNDQQENQEEEEQQQQGEQSEPTSATTMNVDDSSVSEQQKTATEEPVYDEQALEAFGFFDPTQSGFIHVESIENILYNIGVGLTRSVYTSFVSNATVKRSGRRGVEYRAVCQTNLANFKPYLHEH